MSQYIAYQYSWSEVVEHFTSNSSIWLTESQAKERLTQYGQNILAQSKKISPRVIFWQQFMSPLVLILIGAALVSFFVGDVSGAVIIAGIVVLNGAIGFFQEYKSEKSIEALKSMMSLHSTVLRDGKKQDIDSLWIVPGDIVLLEEGDTIPADGRILTLNNLETAESALTGESLPIIKSQDSIESEVSLGDQRSLVFSSTNVTKWFWSFVVTATGMNTEIWKIATMIDKVEDKQTHLQVQLGHLGKRLGIAVIFICIIIFISYYFGHKIWLTEAFLAAIALAVAAIPEGLPAVVTISLSLGVNRMLKRNALVRKLASVETLGSVDIICTDKTWTLTKNEMTVKEVYVDQSHIHVKGTGYALEWIFEQTSSSLDQLLIIGALCNHASLTSEGIIGDPTEACLLVSAAKGGITHDTLSSYTYIDEIPFDSVRKKMTTIYEHHGQYHIFSKWAPESLLENVTQLQENGNIRPITDQDRESILQQTNTFADDALRVLAFAYKVSDDKAKDKAESDLIFVGLQAIIDPAREEVKEAIAVCNNAGIRVIMITWDNIKTAQAIAGQLNITGKAMTWTELDLLSDEELLKDLHDYSIFARVNPSHKQRLVKLLQSTGHIVAMTWDGVNDAPALKQADIGVAMGITWTDVSKQAADIILLDDNFTTIVHAIEEWRGIYDNIKKFVNYMLSTNMSEVLILFVMSVVGLPLPFLAIHLLRINLVTDWLPALALWVDPSDPSIMSRKPLKSSAKIIDKDMTISIVVISVLIMLSVVFFFARWYHINLEMARTWSLLLLVILEIMRVEMIRATYHIWLFSNKYLIGALVLSLWLALMIVYTPLSQYFQTLPPSSEMWIEILLFAGATYWAGFVARKIRKYFLQKSTREELAFD